MESLQDLQISNISISINELASFVTLIEVKLEYMKCISEYLNDPTNYDKFEKAEDFGRQFIDEDREIFEQWLYFDYKKGLLDPVSAYTYFVSSPYSYDYGYDDVSSDDTSLIGDGSMYLID